MYKYYVHVYVGDSEDQKGVLDFLELKLQAAVNYGIWVLKTKLPVPWKNKCS